MAYEGKRQVLTLPVLKDVGGKLAEQTWYVSEEGQAALQSICGSGYVGVSNALSIYPVGAVYLSLDDTDPGSLFGGTWEDISIAPINAQGVNTWKRTA